MSNVYYETIDKMEKSGVDKEYINGWAGGFLHNPRYFLLIHLMIPNRRRSYRMSFSHGVLVSTGR